MEGFPKDSLTVYKKEIKGGGNTYQSGYRKLWKQIGHTQNSTLFIFVHIDVKFSDIGNIYSYISLINHPLDARA